MTRSDHPTSPPPASTVMASNISMFIEYAGTAPDPLVTLGELRAATAWLPDDTLLTPVFDAQYEFFTGIRIGGE